MDNGYQQNTNPSTAPGTNQAPNPNMGQTMNAGMGQTQNIGIGQLPNPAAGQAPMQSTQQMSVQVIPPAAPQPQTAVHIRKKREQSNKIKPLIGLIVCLVIVLATVGIGLCTDMFEKVKNSFSGVHFNTVRLFYLVLMISSVLAIEKMIVLILGLFKHTSHRSATVVTITQSIMRYGSAIVILCWGLAILGVNVSTIAASVGIITLIVGFGAESLIEDVITGFFMLFENQYNVGDIVEIGGFRGTVSDIGIRTTSIMDTGGNVKIINNSNMKDILNRSDNISRSVADIQIPYETDLEVFETKIPAMMEEIYKLHTDKMRSAPRYIGVQELGESGITLRFVVDVHESDIYSVQRILNRELFVFFRKAQVECPYPQVDVHQK